MPYYGPRFQPSAGPHPVDEFLGSAQDAFFLLDALKRQRTADRTEAEDRRLRLEEIERRRGFEDYERGAVPEGEELAPRERREYATMAVPATTIRGVDTDPPLGDGNPLAEALGDVRDLPDLRPRRFPGLDPYEAGGRTYDPELALRRRQGPALAAAMESAEAQERNLSRMAAELEAAGVPPERARILARNPALLDEELYPSTRGARAWQPQTREEAEAWERFKASLRPGNEPKPPISVKDAMAEIELLYPEGAIHEVMTEAEHYRLALKMANGTLRPEDLPRWPPVEEEEPKGPGFWTRVGRLVPGGHSPFSDAPAGAPPPGARREPEAEARDSMPAGGGARRKRPVTADQAEYLKAIGRWDPDRYEVVPEGSAR